MKSVKLWVIASLAFLAGGLLTYFIASPKNVPIIWLGDNRERFSGLPLNNPSTVRAKNADHMRDDDLIFGLSYKGVIRAYPQWIMVSYHIVNDTIRGNPLVVSQCEVCSGAAAFVPVVKSNPKASLMFTACGRKFGTFMMCDFQTHSRWHPFLGWAFHGILEGTRLERVPLTVTKWGEWKKKFPETQVIVASRNLHRRRHGRSPEFEFGKDSVPAHLAKTANLTDTRLKRSELVFGIDGLEEDGKPWAVKLKHFPENSLQSFTLDGFRLLALRRKEHWLQIFDISGFPSKIQFFMNKETIKNSEGLSWNILGDPIGDGTHEELKTVDGYITEWYEWVSGKPTTAIFP